MSTPVIYRSVIYTVKVSYYTLLQLSFDFAMPNEALSVKSRSKVISFHFLLLCRTLNKTLKLVFIYFITLFLNGYNVMHTNQLNKELNGSVETEIIRSDLG